MKRQLLLSTFLLLACAAFSQVYYVDSSTPDQINIDNAPYDVDDNTALITGGDMISDVFVDEANDLIYWVNSGNGTIGRANLDGTGVNQSFVTTDVDPNYMTIGNGFIYYTHDNGNIGRANEANGLGVDNTYVTGANAPQGIVVRSSIIVWINGGDGSIQISVSGGAASPTDIIGIGQLGATELEIDDNGNLYWLDTNNNTIDKGIPGFTGLFIDEGIVTGVNATTFHLDLDEELIIWNQASNLLGSAELSGANPNYSFVDLDFDVSTGLYTNINLGVTINSANPNINLTLCPGESQSFNDFLSLSDCDLDGDASYALLLRNVTTGDFNETITKNNDCNLDVSIDASNAPSRGFFDLICTIQDPDGVDASGLSGIITSNATSVTFDLGNMEIYTYPSYSSANIVNDMTVEQGTAPLGTALTDETAILGDNLSEMETEEYTFIYGFEDLGDGGVSTTTTTTEWKIIDPDNLNEYDPIGSPGAVTLNSGQQLILGPATNGISIQHISGTTDITIRCTVSNCGITQVFTRNVAILLPVDLVSFEAKTVDKEVVLNWKTAQEINNEGFQIEHSRNGENWVKLGFVAGHGDTNESKTYEYTHDAPTAGKNYYRLKQMDIDGQFDYSDIRMVAFDRSQTTMSPVFPNPVKEGFLHINLDNYSGSEVQIQIYDTAGKLWLQQSSFSANNVLPLSDFVAGIYIVETIIDGQSLRQKVVVQ